MSNVSRKKKSSTSKGNVQRGATARGALSNVRSRRSTVSRARLADMTAKLDAQFLEETQFPHGQSGTSGEISLHQSTKPEAAIQDLTEVLRGL